MSGSNAISPTAHYTGYVWARNGLSHPALSTREGEVLFASLQPAMLASLAELTAGLDPEAGLIIVTEGLLGYLSTSDMTALWERFAAALKTFRAGRYVSDLHLGDAVTPVVRGFRVLLGAVVRGRVYLHFQTAEQAERALLAVGFRAAQVFRAGSASGQEGARLAYILEAST